MVHDQSFPMSLQGNPFLDCQSEQDEKNEVSLDICLEKGNYLCSPENLYPFDQMGTSTQTTQYMKMYELSNSALYNQGTLAS